MNHLLRSLAPISDTVWALLDREARERLMPALGARKLVDFNGPHGWEHSATAIGRTHPPASGPGDGVTARQRRVLPLVELRADFALSRDELRDADRGADDVDLAPLDGAAARIAAAEAAAVFHGWTGAIDGITGASPHDVREDGGTDEYPGWVAAAISVLLAAGVGGPYALAADSDRYRMLSSATERGYPLREHLEKMLGGPLVWVPGLAGAVVLSLRGGDFVLDCGQDVAIGYDSHDGDEVRLYLEESFSFHVATPEAAVALGE